MKKIFLDGKKIAAFALVVFVFSACSKWLDVAPEKELIKDNFWKKTEDANSALAGTYSALRDASLESFIWGELRADIIMNIPGDYLTIAGSDITPTSSVVKWAKYYAAINLANTLMYYDKDVLANDKSFTQKMKNSVDAEALFIRSISYFYMVRLWKNVPLILNPSISDTCNIYPAVTEESGIIKQIISDLLIAKDKAYTTEFQSNPKYFRGRANKYSIMTLLADVYLWNQQYQKCIDYCDSVINTGIYSLEPNETWFNLYNPGNSNESIFEWQFVDDGTVDQINPMYNIAFYGGTTFTTLFNLGAKTANFGFNRKYSSLFPDRSDRRVCELHRPIWKYIGITVNSEVARSSAGERNTHIILYRYADILLMKAEALNELGRLSEALEYVNFTLLRAKPSGPELVANDQIEMRSVIADERAKEFVIEGKRWFDLLRAAKRNNFMYKADLAQILLDNAQARSKDILRSKVNDTMMYYLPVPYSELKLNKNLKQNPFYER
jgi:starch-binding outer membrane protein, SusD/RagB family